ncbi:3-hydroxyacyl-ACP dehydratase [Flavihumibacter sp. UBA7668]|uniref:3-hydroxyacyl-ACP dehydratase n=1 Tax=Flavihumibacter sp. UBA7668 TaxID=1946542 RepID=UPI0025BA3342|nr:3-hydroxyacyl-ACP dehydratase [Flavihumibacter sp. UBA7668]
MTLLINEQLEQILPQRAPFVMIDALVADDPAQTETGFEILPENILTRNGKATAALLVENIAQTAAAGAGYKALQGNGPVLVGFIGAIKNLEIHALPEVGTRLKTITRQVNTVFNVSIVEGYVYKGDQLLASCEIKIFLQEPKS